MKEFTHIDERGNPSMVDVGHKKETERVARAEAILEVADEISSLLDGDEIHTKKGPVFQTAIIAGIQGVKRTSDLIPMCHPLAINYCNVDISMNGPNRISVICEVRVFGKTGVEMEALTGASVAALTIYDMCKGVSQNMKIVDTKLLFKSGGKSDIDRSADAV